MAEALKPDHLLDRRRIRRKLRFWRITGLGLLAILLIGAIAQVTGNGFLANRYGEHIAEVPLEGFIFNTPAHSKLLRRLAEDENVHAVVVRINSPGGTVVGGELLYEALRALSQKKPTVAVIEGVGTSAAYMAALAADRIFAHKSSIVGSIGVIYQNPNVSALLDKLGVEMETIKTGPLKAAPSPFQPTGLEARRVIQTLIDDSYAWFLELFMERRGFDAETARQLGDGRIYSGQRAFSLKLIDALGGREAARAWLIAEHDLPHDLEIKPWRLEDYEERPSNPFTAMAAALIEGLLGKDNALTGQVKLDGLLSVWHAEAAR